ncbi:membrane-localized protein [Candida orthopsilosis Co 90-125]|uniref:Endoplasmic reticulum transmembrane protein n=1 Tax=Candida orthopsilosis (strain 90-125) TaxID=1136231 RepID=H8X7U1_CANO9|nr:membrane-localized protein [Candida orthopsilosis Co 90-125]CCG23877.1 membrane-localized protein [Candida orthopsilosis Co 90-125]
MSLQMLLVFSTMIFQMITLLLFVLPLPLMVRSQIVSIYIKITTAQNFRIFLGFSITLMSLQFYDCLQRLEKYHKVKENDVLQGFVNYDKLASKFYSQRNLYLSGAILYLLMGIYTVASIVKKLVLKEKLYRQLIAERDESRTGGGEKSDGEEVVKVKHLIELKQKDIDALKKQLNGLQTAYDGLNKGEERSKDD